MVKHADHPDVASSSPRDDLPHHDGKRYFNPPQWRPPGWHAGLSLPRSPLRVLRLVLRWRMRFRIAWPDALPPDVRTPSPVPALPRPGPGEAVATFLFHATVLLQFGRADGTVLRILTDPVFSESCSPVPGTGPRRASAPPIPLADLPPIDVILISHCHYDHMDLPSLRALARRDDPVTLTLPGNARHLRKAGLKRIAERDWWGATDTNGARITAAPALHGSARTPFDANRALWGGFVIEAEGRTVFFAGDTAWGLHFDAIHRRWPGIDLALLPIGAYEPRDFLRAVHMNPEEAVMAFDTLRAAQAIALHFGTFQLTDEPVLEPAARLEAAVRSRDFGALKEGESVALTPDGLPRNRASG